MIPEFVRLWESGYEIVAGARTTRAESWTMRKTRSLFYRITNKMADFEIPEKVGEFQLIDRRVADAVLEYRDLYPYLRGLIASVGFKRVIVPYHWQQRKIGKSRLSFLSLIDQAMNGIFAFSSLPMRVCTVSGILLAGSSILYALVVVGAYVLGMISAPQGIPTLIVAVFFFSGVQLTFTGILGEYILTIHRQVRGGPLVVERETINIDD